MADYYTECNNQGVSENDFRLQFCSRCTRSDCSRSAVSGGGFTDRVQTWKERLFTQVPKLPPSDPRFAQIAAQSFNTPETWKSKFIPGADLVSISTGEPQKTTVWNTPFPQDGVYLKSQGETAPAPKRDPWAVPDKNQVKPGATFKF